MARSPLTIWGSGVLNKMTFRPVGSFVYLVALHGHGHDNDGTMQEWETHTRRGTTFREGGIGIHRVSLA